MHGNAELTGRIIRGIAGFYYVQAESGFFSELYACKAKGIFRQKKITPLVGDRVRFTITDPKDMEGNIIEILPRMNELMRPAVANVDQGLVVFAIHQPDPHLRLLDRFLINMKQLGIPVIICFNKQDLDPTGEAAESLKEIYAGSGCETLVICNETGEGVDEVMKRLDHKVTVLAGPSGVGKSSLVNRLQSEIEMETGTISHKLKRGRHTTRRAELIGVGHGGYVIDTPGFSSLQMAGIDKEDLKYCYPEFAPYEGECRFAECRHMSEPDCAVKQAVADGRINADRYHTYCELYRELEELDRRKYR